MQATARFPPMAPASGAARRVIPFLVGICGGIGWPLASLPLRVGSQALQAPLQALQALHGRAHAVLSNPGKTRTDDTLPATRHIHAAQSRMQRYISFLLLVSVCSVTWSGLPPDCSSKPTQASMPGLWDPINQAPSALLSAARPKHPAPGGAGRQGSAPGSAQECQRGANRGNSGKRSSFKTTSVGPRVKDSSDPLGMPFIGGGRHRR